MCMTTLADRRSLGREQAGHRSRNLLTSAVRRASYRAYRRRTRLRAARAR